MFQVHDAGLALGHPARHSFQGAPLMLLRLGQRSSQFANRAFQSSDASRRLLLGRGRRGRALLKR